MGTGFWVGPDFLVVEDEVAKISGFVVGNVLVVHLTVWVISLGLQLLYIL